AEHAPVGGLIGAGAGEVVEGLLGDADDVVGDEAGALTRTVLRMLETAFPLQYGPAGEVVLRELREDRWEIDLAVAERAEATGTVGPGLKTTIDALAPRRIELGVLHVKHADAFVIEVDVGEIIELL